MASETETGTFLNYILSDGEQIFSEDKSHILCNVIIQGTYKKEFNYLFKITKLLLHYFKCISIRNIISVKNTLNKLKF